MKANATRAVPSDRQIVGSLRKKINPGFFGCRRRQDGETGMIWGRQNTTKAPGASSRRFAFGSVTCPWASASGWDSWALPADV
jgi:hypothetical protein